MRTCVLILILTLCAASCTRTVYVPAESVTLRTDTINSVKFRIDSVLLRDSVTVAQKGDTVYHTRYIESYRVRERVDTLYQSVTDSVKVTVPYPVERPLSRWEQAKMDFGGFAMGGTALAVCAVVVWFVRRVRKKR